MEFVPHHLSISAEHTAGNLGRGRLFFLPGSDGRAARIAERFSDREVVRSDRQLNVYLGRVGEDGSAGQVDVAAVATGMGCPSLDIVLTELIKLGGKRFLRVGTAGSLRPAEIRTGDLVLATAAVRDEAASDCYVVREYPAVADLDMVAALQRAARYCGVAGRTYRGVVHSKDSLFGREFGFGPRTAENEEYLRQLAAMGVLASEMETAHLLVLSDVYSTGIEPLERTAQNSGKIRSGAVLAVIGDDSAFSASDKVRQAEEAAIDVAVRAAIELEREYR